MTRKEALNLFGLNNQSTTEEIQAAFSKNYTLIQSKMTNAIDTTIKNKLEESLEEYKEAYKLLNESASLEQNTSNISYPSDKPVETKQKNRTEHDQETNTGVSSFTDEEYKNVKKWRGAFLLTTILSLAIAGLFFAWWWDMKGQMTDLKGQMADFEKLKTYKEKHESLLKNQTFKIVNMGNEPFYLMGYQAIYKDSLGFKKYPTEEFKFLPEAKEIKNTLTISELEWNGAKNNYNGDVLFYSILISNAAGDGLNVYSGILSEEKPTISINPNFNN